MTPVGQLLRESQEGIKLTSRRVADDDEPPHPLDDGCVVWQERVEAVPFIALSNL